MVINWNGAQDTFDLLYSLCHCQSDAVSITAVVIDNASAEADRLKLESGLADLDGRMKVIFRANSVNIGVPAAYNQAIQVAGLTHDYYLRLDNDVIVEQEGLASMIDALEQESRKGVAIVGGNIKYFDRRTEDNGGAVSIDLIAGRTRVTYPLSDVVCDGVLGCIMLLSGELVRRYAPEVFAGNLFICTDESEISLRAARDGMRTMYLARLIGFHKSGSSTGKVDFLSKYYSTRNWTLLRLRYAGGNRQRLSVLMRIPSDLARSVLRRRWPSVLGAAAGLGMALTASLDRGVRHGRC